MAKQLRRQRVQIGIARVHLCSCLEVRERPLIVARALLRVTGKRMDLLRHRSAAGNLSSTSAASFDESALIKRERPVVAQLGSTGMRSSAAAENASAAAFG